MGITFQYRNWLLALLTGILAFNYVDRLALGLMMENIKSELVLSDTQLGLLTGIAFALFYSTMGIPIARWADRGNRVTIITLTTALWSAMVALCAAAGSFVQLLAIRIGVAVGEAGCTPPAQSLIADHFDRDELPRAMGIYTLGGPLSLFFGYFIAGWLNQFYGWRATFVILALPGVALVGLALTLREPRHLDSAKPAAPDGLAQVLATLWANTTFRRLLICISVSNFFMLGILQWLPSFMIRSYGLSTGEIGTGFALSVGVSGVLGNYWGGAVASRYAAGNERLQLRAMAVLWGCSGVLFVCIYLVTSRWLPFVFLALGGMALTATNGPLYAMIQSLIPLRMRATAAAVVQLFSNLIGLGLGPLVAGALSDALKPLFGVQSLRYGLIALCPGYLVCVWLAWRASRSVTTDMAIARSCMNSLNAQKIGYHVCETSMTRERPIP